jgi:hypothetical protein
LGMNVPALPFWVVTEHKHALNPPSHVPCYDPFAPHAFTAADKLTVFLNKRKAGRWDLSLVASRDAVLTIVADAKAKGATHVCFDPEVDGSGGELVNLLDLLAAYE